MKPALFRAEAEAELEEAVAYYEAEKSGLGRDFRKQIEAAVLKIRETPLRWSPLGPDTRRIHVGRFPYAVVYAELPDHILIIAVAHHRRRPGYWKDRI